MGRLHSATKDATKDGFRCPLPARQRRAVTRVLDKRPARGQRADKRGVRAGA